MVCNIPLNGEIQDSSYNSSKTQRRAKRMHPIAGSMSVATKAWWFDCGVSPALASQGFIIPLPWRRSYHQRLLVQSKLICCDISCDITLIKDVREHVFSTIISFPNAPCMEHLPRFTPKLPKRRNIYHTVIWSIWLVGGFNPSEKY